MTEAAPSPVATSTLRIRPLPSTLGARAAASGRDDTGAPVRVRVDVEGEPLRCCLRDSRTGERVVLISATPEGPTGAYVERGPVFVHADDCGGPVATGAYPAAWRRRRQVFRAYGGNGAIVGGELVEPHDDQDAAARRLLASPEVAFVQTRNVIYGCYMATIERA
jgi:Protein of unknown function (DUF1203)